MVNSVFIFILIFALGAIGVYFCLVHLFPAIRLRTLAGADMPESWEKKILEHVEGFNDLEAKDQEAIRRLVKVYMGELYLEPKRMKWQDQMKITIYLAHRLHKEKSPYLKKLKTIKIGKKTLAQGDLLEVQSIEELKTTDLSLWL